jgi:hypothetical protein
MGTDLAWMSFHHLGCAIRSIAAALEHICTDPDPGILAATFEDRIA